MAVEIIAASISCEDKWGLKLLNIATGSRISEYSGEHGSNGRHFIAVGNGCILEAQEGNARINIWPFNKYNQDSGARIIAPGRISAFTATSDQQFLTFSVNEKIYFYQAETGVLQIVGNSHFQAVKVIKFSKDECFIACGGEDGLVSLWNISAILSPANGKDVFPFHLFSNHLLPVTDIAFTQGITHLRIVTVSEDRTAKVYDVTSGKMLISIIFDVSVKCVALPVSDTGMYIGKLNGIISEIFYQKAPDVLECHYIDIAKPQHNFCGHSEAVTCLALTTDCFNLISGSDDSTIRVWETTTHHCLYIINEKGPIHALTVKSLPCYAFEHKFKYNFRTFLREKNDKFLVEINTLKNLSRTQCNSSKNESPNFSKKIETLKNSNKSLYKFIMRRLVHSVASSKRSKVQALATTGCK